MAYSTQRAVSDGTMTYLDLSIGYQSRDDIKVFFNDLPAPDGSWAWVGTTDKRISFSPAVPSGVEVLVQRNTRIDRAINVFAQGAKFNNTTMDTNFTQVLYSLQEAVEGHLISDVFNPLNMHGYPVHNVGDATADGDAVSLRVLDQRYPTFRISSTGVMQWKPANASDTAWADVGGLDTGLPGQVTAMSKDLAARAVWVHQFGAMGDGSDQTVQIRNAIAYMKSQGGGLLMFGRGDYVVHVDNPTWSPSTPGNDALLIDFDNLHMRGMGVGATTLRAKGTDGTYTVMRIGKIPVTNGNPQIRNFSLSHMTVDGYSTNPQPVVPSRSPAIIGTGLVDSEFYSLKVQGAAEYGIGLQNGGHQQVHLHDIWFEGCGRNAIDVKNNGSVNTGIKYHNLDISNCGWVDYDDEASSMLSIGGYGASISKVTFRNLPTGDRTISRVLRLKPGTTDWTQGVGAADCIVSDITILNGSTYPASLTCAIEVECEGAHLSNVVIRGAFPLGIKMTQPRQQVTGGVIDGSDVGVSIRTQTVSAPAQAYDRATDCRVSGMVFKNNSDTAILNNGLRSILVDNTFDTCSTAINNSGSFGTNSVVADNTFVNCATQVRGDSSSGQLWFNNNGAVGPSVGVVLEGGLPLNATFNFNKTARFMGADGTVLVGQFNHTVNSVNYLMFYNSVTASATSIRAAGADADVTLTLWGKGAGDITVQATSLSPRSDGTISLGKPSLKWSVIYSTTGSINTSDARYKTEITDLSEAERRVAAACRAGIKKYKLVASVAEKGDDARWHIGVLAQDVVAAFKAEGLDALTYGIVGYDEWDAIPAEVDADGTVLVPEVPAGSRWGIRYDELHSFILSSL